MDEWGPTNMAPRRIPTTLQRAIKGHQSILRKVTQKGGNRLLKFVPKTFFPLVKQIFKSIRNGSLAVPFNISRALLDKVIRAKNSEKVVLQNGSGVVSILAHVIPAIASIIPSIVKLFRKSKSRGK